MPERVGGVPRVSSLAEAVTRAKANAPFLRELIRLEPDVVDALLAGQNPIPLPPALADAPLARRLRVRRRRLALEAALRDLGGGWDLTAVTEALTRFADQALHQAIAAAVAERAPGAEPVGFVALALGKQGSFELNYSSDIDPIFLYDPETLPRRARDEPVEAATRIARRVVELLSARDADGYVLRVDLRLRPMPEASPPALSIDAATAYYEAHALPWERAAFIRARAAAGDVGLGRRFLETIRPFIWRRTLDFGAAAELQDVTRRIRDHYAEGQAFGPGYDLKRGRGGIREAEFLAQRLQLIHGGRDPRLRTPATRDALSALAAAGLLPHEEAAAVSDAYGLLRTVEHRVQMVEDRQTHRLPEAGAALDAVARLHGVEDGAALLDLLRPAVAQVARSYGSVPDPVPTLPVAGDILARALGEAGFADPAAAAARIAAWRGGAYPALRSAAARAALEPVLPDLTRALAGAADPDAALNRLDRLLERLPSAVNLFRLLEARPGLGQLLAAVLAHAPTLSDELAVRPALLDGLIDASALGPVPDAVELAAAMIPPDREADYQAVLDQVRLAVGEGRFALGARIVEGRTDALAVAEGYAALAEAALGALAARTVAEFERVHGRVAGGELVILALGRFGGGAMTHASDLDLVYLFTGDFAAQSDGARPLGATLYFNRLASRVTNALSVPTAAGPLYPVDTRLRPQGAQGPIAVSLDSFAVYQRTEAWTWEHMALTRARPVFGSAAARFAVEAVIAEVLAGGRRPRDVAADARTMRADMGRHKPSTGPLDVKLGPGGLVDLEFAVHVIQLTRSTGFDPHLGRAVRALAADGLVTPGLADAHDLLTRLLVTLRLLAPDANVPPPATCALVATVLGLADWDAVLASLEAARQEVTRIWEATGDG